MTNRVEHRRALRMAAAVWVRLGSGGAELGMANLANVSVSGAFLETSLKLPVSANITLEPLSSAGVALDGLKIAARVARVDGRGLGIEWRTMLTQERLALLGVQTPPPPEWRWPQAG
jgi:hypothetical protein